MNMSRLTYVMEEEEVVILPEIASWVEVFNVTHNSSVGLVTSEAEEETEAVSASLASTRFVVQTIITPIVVTIGLLGNFFNILVLVQPNMRTSTNVYLLTLAMADSVYLIFSFTLSFVGCRRRGLSYAGYAFNTYGRTISDMAGNIAVWIIVIFTVERYVAVCHPMYGKIWCTVRRAKMFSLLAALFCLANTMPGFFELEIVQGSSGPRCQYTEFASSPGYELGYTWWYVTIFTFVPFSFLLIFNSLLIYTLIHAARDRELMLAGGTGGGGRRVRGGGGGFSCLRFRQRMCCCCGVRDGEEEAGESEGRGGGEEEGRGVREGGGGCRWCSSLRLRQRMCCYFGIRDAEGGGESEEGGDGGSGKYDCCSHSRFMQRMCFSFGTQDEGERVGESEEEGGGGEKGRGTVVGRYVCCSHSTFKQRMFPCLRIKDGGTNDKSENREGGKGLGVCSTCSALPFQHPVCSYFEEEEEEEVNDESEESGGNRGRGGGEKGCSATSGIALYSMSCCRYAQDGCKGKADQSSKYKTDPDLASCSCCTCLRSKEKGCSFDHNGETSVDSYEKEKLHRCFPTESNIPGIGGSSKCKLAANGKAYHNYSTMDLKPVASASGCDVRCLEEDRMKAGDSRQSGHSLNVDTCRGDTQELNNKEGKGSELSRQKEDTEIRDKLVSFTNRGTNDNGHETNNQDFLVLQKDFDEENEDQLRANEEREETQTVSQVSAKEEEKKWDSSCSTNHRSPTFCSKDGKHDICTTHCSKRANRQMSPSEEDKKDSSCSVIYGTATGYCSESSDEPKCATFEIDKCKEQRRAETIGSEAYVNEDAEADVHTSLHVPSVKKEQTIPVLLNSEVHMTTNGGESCALHHAKLPLPCVRTEQPVNDTLSGEVRLNTDRKENCSVHHTNLPFPSVKTERTAKDTLSCDVSLVSNGEKTVQYITQTFHYPPFKRNGH